MVDFPGFIDPMSLNDVQRMQGGGPPGPGNDDYQSVKRAFLNNSEPKDVYVNYGDADPEGHGGLFVSAEVSNGSGGRDVTFDVFETIPAYDYAAGEPDEHYTLAGAFKMDEIVTVDGQWTPTGNPSNIMGAPPTPMGAAVDNRMLWVVAGVASQYLEPYPYQNNLMTGDYDDILDRLGVTPRQM
jgi:hypothetical protein